MDTEAPVLAGKDGGMRPGRRVSEGIRAHGKDPASEASPTRRQTAVVGVTSRGQPLEPCEQALGGRRRGGFREDVLQAPLGVGLGLALGTRGEMGEHPLARVMPQLTVDQSGQPVSQMLLDRCRT
jgi:hypothetical protein